MPRTMKRHSVTILKFALFVGAFLFIGWPFFGSLKQRLDRRSLAADRGLRVNFNEVAQVHAPGLREKMAKKSETGRINLQNRNNNENNDNVFDDDDNIKNKVENHIKEKFSEDKEEKESEPTKELIDWHDYRKIEQDKERNGPGEQGVGVIIGPEEEKLKQELFMTNGFNGLASDKISLHRSINDIRHPNCWNKRYYLHLPKASVVVPFHNEHWSTLLRTVYGVLENSPTELIEEIILVDDYSSKLHCKEKLTDYVKKYFTNVKIIRAKRREGLIRTRLLGARAAKGPVLIFLDSHVEPNTNWLPPLLQPIADDRKTVTCPFIDVIDYETFAYRAQDEGARGAFDWRMDYKRLPKLKESNQNPAEVFESPVMAGGLFAISASWFWELGGYDPGLEIWGGEQYELSFKTWQCGGRMVDVPCSRIGHIYRSFAPFSAGGVGDYLGHNHKRVAEVWMDDYKKYVYKHMPQFGKADAGNITGQLELRKRLKCKSFKWFMEEIAFDLVKHYPPVIPKSSAHGEIRNVASNLCIDTRFQGVNKRFMLDVCTKDAGTPGEQKFEITWRKDLRPWRRNVCFDSESYVPRSPVVLYSCHGQKGNQYWKYNIETRLLYHPSTISCLDCDPNTKEIFTNPCDNSKKTQQWKFEFVNRTALLIEWSQH